jgi:hypothetical protein
MFVSQAATVFFLMTAAALPQAAAGSRRPADQTRATPAPTRTPRPRVRSLADLARRIHLRWPPGAAARGGGKVEITDENLPALARRGRLTTSSPGKMTAPSSTAPAAGVGEGTTHRGREYWRTRYAAELKKIHGLEREIGRLEAEIPGLWRTFYAWDDPAYRDGVIKPKLDRDLAEVTRLKAQLEAKKAELPRILEAARRDGAQPGWFRDLEAETP